MVWCHGKLRRTPTYHRNIERTTTPRRSPAFSPQLVVARW
jgi:hypothetical protein